QHPATSNMQSPSRNGRLSQRRPCALTTVAVPGVAITFLDNERLIRQAARQITERVGVVRSPVMQRTRAEHLAFIVVFAAVLLHGLDAGFAFLGVEPAFGEERSNGGDPVVDLAFTFEDPGVDAETSECLYASSTCGEISDSSVVGQHMIPVDIRLFLESLDIPLQSYSKVSDAIDDADLIAGLLRAPDDG